MIAEKLGPAVWDTYAKKFGDGQPTGIGLPGESAGILPPIEGLVGQPFGEPADRPGRRRHQRCRSPTMYQTIANNGVRVPPHIVEKIDRAHRRGDDSGAGQAGAGDQRQDRRDDARDAARW